MVNAPLYAPDPHVRHRCQTIRSIGLRRLLLWLGLIVLCIGVPSRVCRADTFASLFSFMGPSDGINPQSNLIQATDGNFYGVTSVGGTYGVGTVFQRTSTNTFTTLYVFTGGADGANPQGLMQATDGYLYGVTAYGGASNPGTVFRITTGGALTTLHSFGNQEGDYPEAGLIQGSDGNLYGTTSFAGPNGSGSVFQITLSGTLTVLHGFDFQDGDRPMACLLQASDGNLYGTTSLGGVYGQGTVFRVTTAGTFTSLYSFTAGYNAGSPEAPLIQASDGNLYGTASVNSTVFRITTGGTLTTLYTFGGSIGVTAGLIQASDGSLYGTAAGGGANGRGTVFKISTGGAYTLLYSFGAADGSFPQAGLIQARNGKLYGATAYGGVNDIGTLFQITTSGTLTTLYSFIGGTDGARPAGNLIQASDASLYGTTPSGGSHGVGTVFAVTTEGTFDTLYSFSPLSGGSYGSNSDGAYPQGGLVQAKDGNLYGTAQSGGTSLYGTVFRIATDGTLTTLTAFNSMTGSPTANLILASDGSLYGTTAESYPNTYGTVFRITTDGTFTTIHSFSQTDGADPSGLVQATDGNLYGTTFGGGTNGYGTLFKLTTGGTLSTLYNFTSSDGYSNGSLIQATDHDLYGTTENFSPTSYSTVFKITTAGAFTRLYTSYQFGTSPSGLVQARDGNLYGTTSTGGANFAGTIFQMTRNGVLTTLHNFAQTDGAAPVGLMQASDGRLYGMTTNGGAYGLGTAFSVGISPDVASLNPTSTPADTAISLTIHGAGFVRGAVVTWNGTPIKSIVVNANQINAKAPASVNAPLSSYPGTAAISVTNPDGDADSGSLIITVPLPFISSIDPRSLPVGGPQTTLTLTGRDFAPGGIVYWNNSALATTFVSPTRLTAIVPAADLSTAAKVFINVLNSPGGSSGNYVVFIVQAVPNLTMRVGTLSRSGSNVITVPITLSNSGSATADTVQITASTLQSDATTSSLPIAPGDIAVGGSASTALTYPGSVGSKGAKARLVVKGTYIPAGATLKIAFGFSAGVTLP